MNISCTRRRSEYEYIIFFESGERYINEQRREKNQQNYATNVRKKNARDDYFYNCNNIKRFI